MDDMQDDNKVNLLEETIAVLRRHHVSLSNIRFVKVKEGFIPVADFVTQANEIYYDCDSGVMQIDPSLCIAGVTWWMHRIEVNGKEGWLFHKKPRKPLLQAREFNLRNPHPTKMNWEKLVDQDLGR